MVINIKRLSIIFILFAFLANLAFPPHVGAAPECNIRTDPSELSTTTSKFTLEISGVSFDKDTEYIIGFPDPTTLLDQLPFIRWGFNSARDNPDADGVIRLEMDRERGTINGEGGPGHHSVLNQFNFPGRSFTIAVGIAGGPRSLISGTPGMKVVCATKTALNIVESTAVACDESSLSVTPVPLKPRDTMIFSGRITNAPNTPVYFLLTERPDAGNTTIKAADCGTTDSNGNFTWKRDIAEGASGNWLLEVQRRSPGRCQGLGQLQGCQLSFPFAKTGEVTIGEEAYTSKDLYCPGGINTAIGCIPTKNTDQFIPWVLGWVFGIAGGIAFLLLLSSGFMIMTASGNPEKLQHGREVLTAAVSGLIFILFSVFLLRLIGINILNIPGLI